jgi:hypothetical protein
MNSSNNVVSLAGRILNKRDLYFRGDRKGLGILGNGWVCRVGAPANAVSGNCGGTRG